jgi:hypothetical protein
VRLAFSQISSPGDRHWISLGHDFTALPRG